MWLQCIVFWGGERADENATVDENAKRSQAGALCEPAAAPANARPASCPRRCPLRPPKTFQATKTFQDTNTARACGSMQPHLDLAPGSRAKTIWSTISLLIAATGFWPSRFLIRSLAIRGSTTFFGPRQIPTLQPSTTSSHLHFIYMSTSFFSPWMIQ